MSERFKISDEIEADDIVDELLTEAVERLEAERVRLLATAYAYGYDGVDVYPETALATTPDDFRLVERFETWQGEPPEISPNMLTPVPIRYDFRFMDELQEIELLSHVGLRPEDVPIGGDAGDE